MQFTVFLFRLFDSPKMSNPFSFRKQRNALSRSCGTGRENIYSNTAVQKQAFGKTRNYFRKGVSSHCARAEPGTAAVEDLSSLTGRNVVFELIS